MVGREGRPATRGSLEATRGSRGGNDDAGPLGVEVLTLILKIDAVEHEMR